MHVFDSLRSKIPNGLKTTLFVTHNFSVSIHVYAPSVLFSPGNTLTSGRHHLSAQYSLTHTHTHTQAVFQLGT